MVNLRSTFHFFDRDSSGLIDLPEFSKAMEAFGLQFTEEQLIAVFAVHDDDLQGGLSYEKFSAAMQQERVQQTAQHRARLDAENQMPKKSYTRATGFGSAATASVTE